MSGNITENPIFRDAGILLVDDEPMFLELLKIICQKAGFKHVFTARDGIEALKVLQRHSEEIDLLSLDLAMPCMDGLKVAEIVANSHDRIVGLIMVTGLGSDEIQNDFFALGSEIGLTEKYVTKPFSTEQIISEYSEAIRDVFAKREKQLEVGVVSAFKQVKASLIANAIDLSRIQETLDSVQCRLLAIEKLVGNETPEKSQPKTVNDLSYVWALTVIFLLISGGLAWASEYFNLPLLSILALASVTILVLMLIAVFDLSKGGKLSEKSLMEVLRKAFTFISRRRK